MIKTASPMIKKLDRARCEEILARNHVGRIAYTRGNQLEIEPIHYVYADGWIYGRTSRGAKTDVIGTGWWPVVFEVDEAEHLFRWRSVLVHGGFYVLPTSRSEADVAQWERAVSLLRSLIPESLAENDPVPFRTIVFGISAQEMSGREAAPAETIKLTRKQRPTRPGRRRGRAHRLGELRTEERAARPVLVLGEASETLRRIRAVLNAAGYRVLAAATPEDLILMARQAHPRAILAPVEPGDEWRRLLSLSAAHLPAAVPLVLVGGPPTAIEGVSGVVSSEGSADEPGFARRLLDEVRYAEQKTRVQPGGWSVIPASRNPTA
jgi:uncharacterized protein